MTLMMSREAIVKACRRSSGSGVGYRCSTVHGRAAVLAAAMAVTAGAMAAVTIGGDAGEVTSQPWTVMTPVSIGRSTGKTGTVTISDGSAATMQTAQLATASGATGLLTITGTGSTLNALLGYVGYMGTGTVQVLNGGTANFSGDVLMGYTATSVGHVVVSGTGSTWSNSYLIVGQAGTADVTVTDGGRLDCFRLLAPLTALVGNGTINTTGIVTDGPVTFSPTYGGSHTVVPFGSGGTINVNLTQYGTVGAGYTGEGTLSISGVAVNGSEGYFGYRRGSHGTGIVSGSNTTWTSGDAIYIGYEGAGSLELTGGAKIDSYGASIAQYSGSSGEAMVSGAGSAWSTFGTNGAGGMTVGMAGPGKLTILNGGQVSNAFTYVGGTAGTSVALISGPGSKLSNTGDLTIAYDSRGIGSVIIADGGQVTAKSVTLSGTNASMDLRVSGDSMLVLGSATTAGALANYGQVSFYADAFLPAGTYRPITDLQSRTMTWTGVGTYRAIGGTWSTSAKTLTVGAATPVASGANDTLANGERLMITHAASGKHVGVSFGTGVAGMTFSASPMTAGDLAGLPLGSGETVMDAWNFSASGSPGTVLLAFDIGPGASGLEVWHYTGGAWIAYTPTDLQYLDGRASFTVSSFSGYALTGMVPEPGLAGIVIAGAGLLGLRRKRSAWTSNALGTLQ